jgi:hypothetical protein
MSNATVRSVTKRRGWVRVNRETGEIVSFDMTREESRDRDTMAYEKEHNATLSRPISATITIRLD